MRIQAQILEKKGLYSADGTYAGYPIQFVAKRLFRAGHEEAIVHFSHKRNPIRICTGRNVLVKKGAHKCIISFFPAFIEGCRSQVLCMFGYQSVASEGVNKGYI